MTDKKTKLKPSRRPKPEDYRGATRRAQEIHDRLKAQDFRFSDSTEHARNRRDPLRRPIPVALAEDSETVVITADSRLLKALEGTAHARLAHPLADAGSLVPDGR